MPSERWQPAAVAQLALIILIGTALLNLVERIIVAIKVRLYIRMRKPLFSLEETKSNITQLIIF